MLQKYWLMKSEPSVYSIDQLKKDKKTLWEGVRNYQARNFMISEMNPNDHVLLYHSSADVTGIAGLAKISKVNQVDPTQFQAKSEHFDPKSKKETPTWKCAEVEFVEKFSQVITLSELKQSSELKDMLVLKRGQRLSIQPVSKKHFEFIIKKLAKRN
jgi:predicted RNA-binding protein with PUA-like domain